MSIFTAPLFHRLLVIALIGGALTACSSWPKAGQGGAAELDSSKGFYIEQVDFAQEQGALQNQLNLMSIRIDNLALRGAQACLPARLRTLSILYTRAHREIDAQMLDDANDTLVSVHHKLNQLEQRLDKVQRITGCSIERNNSSLILALLENLLNTENSFNLDSDRLNSRYKEKLKTVSSYLVDRVDIDIHITGHTDSSGLNENNKQLAKNRAKALKTLLEEYGVASHRIRIGGASSSRPIYDNKDVAGRLNNRRINVELITIKPDFTRILRDWDHDE